MQVQHRPPGIDAGLEETFYWEPSTVTWSYAAHVVTLEIDPGTGHVEVLDYTIVDDVGRIINPLTLHGQVMGAVVQGRLVYQPEGKSDKVVPIKPAVAE